MEKRAIARSGSRGFITFFSSFFGFSERRKSENIMPFPELQTILTKLYESGTNTLASMKFYAIGAALFYAMRFAALGQELVAINPEQENKHGNKQRPENQPDETE